MALCRADAPVRVKQGGTAGIVYACPCNDEDGRFLLFAEARGSGRETLSSCAVAVGGKTGGASVRRRSLSGEPVRGRKEGRKK
jgi:hypothetical protein